MMDSKIEFSANELYRFGGWNSMRGSMKTLSPPTFIITEVWNTGISSATRLF
jgi:hypothetical protein